MNMVSTKRSSDEVERSFMTSDASVCCSTITHQKMAAHCPKQPAQILDPPTSLTSHLSAAASLQLSLQQEAAAVVGFLCRDDAPSGPCSHLGGGSYRRGGEQQLSSCVQVWRCRDAAASRLCGRRSEISSLRPEQLHLLPVSTTDLQPVHIYSSFIITLFHEFYYYKVWTFREQNVFNSMCEEKSVSSMSYVFGGFETLFFLYTLVWNKMILKWNILFEI